MLKCSRCEMHVREFWFVQRHSCGLLDGVDLHRCNNGYITELQCESVCTLLRVTECVIIMNPRGTVGCTSK